MRARAVRARAVWLGALLGLSGAAWGADVAALRKDYLRSLERFEQNRGVSLERVYDGAREVSRALEAEASPPGLPGLVFSEGEALRVAPDPRFFLDLAKRRGTDVDEEFFSLLRRTYHRDAVLRVYEVPSGCVVFGHPELEPLYRNWTRFWATHPRAYADVVDREVAAVEDAVAHGTCACDDREAVEAGLERFLKSFPHSPVVPEVRARLEQVRAGTSDVRFRCQP
jgi:hypothetical protein